MATHCQTVDVTLGWPFINLINMLSRYFDLLEIHPGLFVHDRINLFWPNTFSDSHTVFRIPRLKSLTKLLIQIALTFSRGRYLRAMTWEFQGRCTCDRLLSAFSEPEALGAHWQEAERRHQQTQRRNSFFIPEQSMLGFLRVNHLTQPVSSSRGNRFYLSMSQSRIWCEWTAGYFHEVQKCSVRAGRPWCWFEPTNLVYFSFSPHFSLPILHLSTLFSNYANDFVTTWGCFHRAGEHNTPQSRAWFMLQSQLSAECSATANNMQPWPLWPFIPPVAVAVWRGEVYFRQQNVNLMVRLVVNGLLSHHLDMSHKLVLGLSSRGRQQAVAASYKLASSRSEGSWKESYKCTHFWSFCFFKLQSPVLQCKVTFLEKSGDVEGYCVGLVATCSSMVQVTSDISAQIPCQIRF